MSSLRAEAHHEHRDVTGGWLRPTVFGAMDGLVSNFALLAGVSGGDAGHTAIVLAGLAGLVGGAASMASGEYLSVQTQNESTHAELEVERRELEIHAADELNELTDSFVARGVAPDLAREVARQLSHDPQQALEVHAREELGVDPARLPRPLLAAGSSLVSFALGAIVPLVPFLAGARSVWISAVVSMVALFAAGALAARFTGRGWLFSGARQLVLGALAAAVTYGVGAAFGAATG